MIDILDECGADGDGRTNDVFVYVCVYVNDAINDLRLLLLLR